MIFPFIPFHLPFPFFPIFSSSKFKKGAHTTKQLPLKFDSGIGGQRHYSPLPPPSPREYVFEGTYIGECPET